MREYEKRPNGARGTLSPSEAYSIRYAIGPSVSFIYYCDIWILRQRLQHRALILRRDDFPQVGHRAKRRQISCGIPADPQAGEGMSGEGSGTALELGDAENRQGACSDGCRRNNSRAKSPEPSRDVHGLPTCGPRSSPPVCDPISANGAPTGSRHVGFGNDSGKRRRQTRREESKPVPRQNPGGLRPGLRLVR